LILHSPRFVLVDRQGQIRGYYDNRDAKARQRLNEDVSKLLRD
jgi:cytochrome oxidase Cu insertion factor (SCO1/SenC/PrrC family)